MCDNLALLHRRLPDDSLAASILAAVRNRDNGSSPHQAVNDAIGSALDTRREQLRPNQDQAAPEAE